jgi:hypothetical protein
MAERLPGAGLWGWLGRQFGYVTKAVKADVTQEVVHREERIQEATLPDRPEVKLRRTVIDEVIVKKEGSGSRVQGSGESGQPRPPQP